MRVALVIYGSLDTVSGGYLYDRKLVEQLRARGHTIEIVSLPWRSYGRHLADNLRPAWRPRLRALACDVLLEDELNHPSLAFAPRPAGAQVATIVHHLRVSEAHPAPLRPLYRAVERFYLRRADALICNSHTTQATVAALRSPLPPSVVAFPAGDHVLATLPPANHGSARDAGAPLHVAFVGNLIPRKGLHTLIAALARVDAPVQLTVAGSEATDPRYAARMRRQVQQSGLDARVHFLGSVSEAERARLYARCDLLAVPSYEGFGIVYLEAMAFGKPSIAANTGAAHEIIADGVNGYLVPPDDADLLASRLAALAADRHLLGALSAGAARRFADFPTWAQSSARTVDFLEGLSA